MPDAPEARAPDGAAADAAGDTHDGAAASDDREPAGPGRSPGWREVLAVAVAVLAVVFAVEILSSLLPPVGEAFRGLPVTIVVLVVGTVGLLVLLALRRPRA